MPVSPREAEAAAGESRGWPEGSYRPAQHLKPTTIPVSAGLLVMDTVNTPAFGPLAQYPPRIAATGNPCTAAPEAKAFPLTFQVASVS